MRYSLASIAALALPTLSLAQIYGPAPGPAGGSSSSTPTSTSLPAVASAPPSGNGFVNVDVAFNETFTFNPANFTASNGTVVTFFFPNAGLQHTVTQSSFDEPCTPLAANASTGAPAGFTSGPAEGMQWSINITNDQVPIWFHCEMPTHCGLGMVGAINAPSTGNTFDAFMANALAIGNAGEPTETIGSPVLTGFGAFATLTPTNTASVTVTSGGSGSGSSSDAKNLIASSATVLMGVALSMIFLL